MNNATDFVNWFRSAAPYVHAHRGKTFVIGFGGESLSFDEFPNFIHDIALLNSLGIRIVLVPGARLQTLQLAQERGVDVLTASDGTTIVDKQLLSCVKEATSVVRLEIEALFSMGLPNSPMAGAEIQVASGNYIKAKPLGVRDGVDFLYAGEVRKVDTESIKKRLSEGEIVLIMAVGYSSTGDIFNLSEHQVAAVVAKELAASKIIFLTNAATVLDEKHEIAKELTLHEAKELSTRTSGKNKELEYAVTAVQNGVERAHLIPSEVKGALLQELFTRDGVGTMISVSSYDSVRKAQDSDVGGILTLLSPFEEAGILVRRSKEKLEQEIHNYTVLIRDRAVIGCGAVYPYLDHQNSANNKAEIACMVVNPDYREKGRGEQLLNILEKEALQCGASEVFVLTTHTAHWFIEHGFKEGKVENLPQARQKSYNRERNSKVFFKRVVS